MKLTNSNYIIYGFSLIICMFIIQFSYGLSILNPENINWLMSAHHDWGTHYLGWAFYREDPWTFPLGYTESYNYPLGTNVGFTDTIPLLAFIFKPFRFLMPEDFQFFGLWLFLCHYLTAVYSFKIFNLFKVNTWLAIFAVILIAANPVLLFRCIHPALSSHFIIVGSIYNYLKNSKSNADRINIHQVILFFIAGTVNPYIAAMIFGFNIILPLKHYFIERSINIKKLLIYPIISLSSVMIFWLFFGMIELNNPTNLASVEKYNFYSFNLNSFFNSYGHYSKFFPDLGSTDPRQYEGFAYLGLGLMIIILCSLLYVITILYRKKILSQTIKKYSLLLMLCIGLTLFAITNELTFGKQTIAILPLPGIIEKLGFIFRASGRFVWPLYYLMLILSLLAFTKINITAGIKAIVLALLTFLQLYDTQKLFSQWNLPSGSYHTPLSDKKWLKVMEKFDNIIVYPPFTYNYSMNYQMDYQDLCYLALKAKKPISNAYVARTNVNKAEAFSKELLKRLNRGEIDDNRLFITTAGHISGFDVLIKKNRVDLQRMDNFIFVYSKKMKLNASDFQNDEETVKYIDSIKSYYKNQKTIEFSPINFDLFEENKISSNFDTFEFKDNILQVRGWAFLKDTHNNKGDSIYIALSSKSRNIMIPMRIDKRPDVTNAFKKEFLDDSGFNSPIETSHLEKDSYQIGIIIKDRQGKYNYTKTDKSITIK
ncbi:MAG TPA: DUF6311 domain-containing protein [Flavobacterium sp.]|nr:DUF6311 domain-containing protein [Flavobacterium sp.]